MSVRRMTAVWEHSQHKGGDLLLLLAIADNAADDGYAWPGIEYLAKKTRMSGRSVIRNIRKLEESGELYVAHNRRSGNRYVVLAGMTDTEIETTLKARFEYSASKISDIMSHIRNYNKCQNVTSEVTPMSHQKCQNVTSEVTPMSHEPSRTINESSNNHHEATPPTFLPEQFDLSVKKIKARTFTRSQYKSILEAEQSRETPRSTLVSYIERKLSVNQHPAVQVFREETHYYPPATWKQSVADRVGENGRLDLWRNIVRAWVGRGWNPRNVSGMLECFERGELPTANGKRKSSPVDDAAAKARGSRLMERIGGGGRE